VGFIRGVDGSSLSVRKEAKEAEIENNKFF
jgi:hypothetical protein